MNGTLSGTTTTHFFLMPAFRKGLVGPFDHDDDDRGERDELKTRESISFKLTH
jgi:hypothetical protein